jgi:hypothetical protein
MPAVPINHTQMMDGKRPFLTEKIEQVRPSWNMFEMFARSRSIVFPEILAWEPRNQETISLDLGTF